MPQATRRWISGKGQIPSRVDCLPFHEILDAEMVKDALDAGRGHVQRSHLHPVRDPLPVPLAGARPRSLVSRRGRAADRLAGGQTTASPARRRPAPTATRGSDSHRRSSFGWSTRPPARSRLGARDDWLWKGRRVSSSTARPSRCPTPPENQAAFPQASSQGDRPGVPDRPVVALISLGHRGGSRPGDGPVQGQGDRRDGAVPHSAGRPRGGRDRAGGPLFRLVFRDRGAVAAGRRRCCSGCTSGGSSTSAAADGWASKTTW